MPYTVVPFNPLATTHRVIDVPVEVGKLYHLPVGMPFLVDATTGLPHLASLPFLESRAKPALYRRTGIVRPDTVRSYAYAVRYHLDFLEDGGIAEAAVTGDVLQDYVEWMLEVENMQTGELLSPETIIQRLSIAISYYKYNRALGAADFEVDAAALYALVTQIENEPIALTDPGDGPRARLGSRRKYMTPEEWRAIAAELDPATTTDRNIVSRRALIAAELSTTTGLRVDEVRWLEVSEFKGRSSGGHAFVPVVARITKGLKSRTVHVPGELFRDCQAYIEGERAAAVETGRKRGASVDHGRVFVNGRDAGSLAGEQVSVATLQRAFRAANLRVPELSIECVLRDGDGRERKVWFPRFRYHDCRHTFAMWMYSKLTVDLGIAEPWVRIQNALGHRSPVTTVRTYLDLSHSLERHAGDLLAAGAREMIHAG